MPYGLRGASAVFALLFRDLNILAPLITIFEYLCRGEWCSCG